MIGNNQTLKRVNIKLSNFKTHESHKLDYRLTGAQNLVNFVDCVDFAAVFKLPLLALRSMMKQNTVQQWIPFLVVSARVIQFLAERREPSGTPWISQHLTGQLATLRFILNDIVIQQEP